MVIIWLKNWTKMFKRDIMQLSETMDLNGRFQMIDLCRF